MKLLKEEAVYIIMQILHLSGAIHVYPLLENDTIFGKIVYKQDKVGHACAQVYFSSVFAVHQVS